jgi:addiction module RelE/StbE family toxin
MKTQINIKVDTIVKKSAQKQAEKLGLSLSSVVNATLSQFARTGELILSVAPKVNPALEALVEEARREYIAGKSAGPFYSSEEMIKSLDASWYMDVYYSSAFKKQYKKLPVRMRQQFRKRLVLFWDNERSIHLRIHKLAGVYKGLWSMDVSGDTRAIFDRSFEGVIIFVAIGSHSELYS